MQKPRRLKPEERAFLRSQGYTPRYFLLLKKTAEGYEFLEKHTGKILAIWRD
ncbi:DUF6906 family protein [Clostridium thermopalmarium]|uniref:DUF6906 domain-containing protein n=1 Tax=Clostridium thermopalmarium DSM 5974 TaxID=1121340 RepID=A0A2T0APQ6_9CLOT|nr:hypothetical protein [Clostridium thermopalmarium]PRR70881.1 hypothetical protein CPAL_19710 [Clostridium thermopalmarium DSM 5974]PVZ28805.1 hypothetical protein LX19_00109 [Clostridium thermopalmarium DSM 5974]